MSWLLDWRASRFVLLFRYRPWVMSTNFNSATLPLKLSMQQLRVHNLVCSVHCWQRHRSIVPRTCPRALVSSRDERGSPHPATMAPCRFYGLDCRLRAGRKCTVSVHHWSHLPEDEHREFPANVNSYLYFT